MEIGHYFENYEHVIIFKEPPRSQNTGPIRLTSATQKDSRLVFIKDGRFLQLIPYDWIKDLYTSLGWEEFMRS